MAQETFAEWLTRALAGRPNVFLVRNSGTKENGRPVIDDSRVSKWRKGEQRPTPEMAVLAADVLNASPREALASAGYDFGENVTYTSPTLGQKVTYIAGDFQRWVETTEVLSEFQRREVLRAMEELAATGQPGSMPLLPDPDHLPDDEPLKARYKAAVESEDPVLNEWRRKQKPTMSETPDRSEDAIAADEQEQSIAGEQESRQEP